MSDLVMHESMTEEQAKALYTSNWWEGKTDREIVTIQLFTARLCMPFGRFHQAVEAALGRSVWTHEFAQAERLQKEFLGERPAPTFEEIVALVPPEKLIVVPIADGGR